MSTRDNKRKNNFENTHNRELIQNTHIIRMGKKEKTEDNVRTKHRKFRCDNEN